MSSLLFTHFDTPEDVQRLVWMPSHRPHHEVGVTEKSDGTELTDIGRTAVFLADRLANAAAARHRVPGHCHARIDDETKEVIAAATSLARVTHATNNVPGSQARDSAPTDRIGA